jgi:hypothetical protein
MNKSLLILLVFCASFATGYRVFGQDDSNPSCWGSQTERCPDGKFHDGQGKEQPDSCDNFAKTGKATVHDCDCSRAKEKTHCNDKDFEPGDKCKVYCRKHACSCRNEGCS